METWYEIRRLYDNEIVYSTRYSHSPMDMAQVIGEFKRLKERPLFLYHCQEKELDWVNCG